MSKLFSYLRPLVHALPPESAHNAALWALRHNLLLAPKAHISGALRVNVWGLSFANPVGLAAGFDKNAVAVNALLKQGFGFVEAGTVTPLPQPGNPTPRIFRLPEDEAVINRLGFNNGGLAAFLRQYAGRDRALGIAGVNIGKNKDSADAGRDYALGIEAVYAQADYITVNISSPNTQGLRDLQQADALSALLEVITAQHARSKQQCGKHMPLLLKVAPDLSMEEKRAIAQCARRYALDGLIVSNTTLSRPSLRSKYAGEQGGLSGKPLFSLSTQALADFYRLTEGALPLIGAGGIASPADAYAKIRAGATLVQLYSALVYQGFSLVGDITRGLETLLQRDGFAHISEAIGADVR